MPDERIRPNPDELLARVQAEEARQARGTLKIFLGYAAGVGKTYAMLEAAHQRRDEGVDVVIGYVETHGRAETDALVAGLEVIPRRQISYQGAVLPEMDVDAILTRRPRLVLVDELAHTNAPGSRHPKRYLDVEDLLDAGIDVYTTMNVQHLESLNDVVAQITGVTVREKVPDSVLDEASAIEVVDLPPPELLQRLKEGKVYVPAQAAQAVQRFFRMGNLTALRELALRRTAERVDEQMRAYMQTRAIPGPWPAGERLLVCVSSSPLSERLVRTARRLADELKAEWFAVYVETPGDAGLSQDRQRPGRAHPPIGRGVGRPSRSRCRARTSPTRFSSTHASTTSPRSSPVSRCARAGSNLLRGTVVDRLILHSGDIDIYVISGEAASGPPAPHRRHCGRTDPGSAICGAWSSLAAITLLSVPIHRFVSPTNLVMLYLAAVVIAAFYLGRGPAILTADAERPRLRFLLRPTAVQFRRLRHRIPAHVRRPVRRRPGGEHADCPVAGTGRSRPTSRGAGRRALRAQPRSGFGQRVG